jgi:hypothetical protein
VAGVDARDRHVANYLVGLHAHQVDRAKQRLGSAMAWAMRANSPPCWGMCRRIVKL